MDIPTITRYALRRFPQVKKSQKGGDKAMRDIKVMGRFLLPFVLALVMVFGITIPAGAATTADVSVTATGAFVSFTSNVSSYDFGTVSTSSTTNSSGTHIGLTNGSSVTTNISVKVLAATWTSAGTGWTHSDTAAGANTVAMKANSTNDTSWGTSVFVKYNSAFNEIATNLAAGATVLTGLSLLAPTSYVDGNSNNNTMRFTIYED